MYFRQLLNDETACASYLLGCKTYPQFAVVDPHVDLVEEYIALADGQGVPLVAVFDTHVQADHVSGLPELVARTGATAYLPEGAGVDFEHHALRDGEVVKLGNTEIEAIATPGHALAHHAYLVTDRTRAEEPWLVLTGDALLVGDAGRPDLHAHGEHTVEQMARTLYRSLTERLLALPDHLVLYPSHYSRLGVRARAVGQPNLHDRLRAPPQPRAATRLRGRVRAGAASLDIPPAPERQAAIVAANRAAGRSSQACERAVITERPVRLGLRENRAQFSLLVAIIAFVGAMVGLERSTLPLIGRENFHLASDAAVLSFIVAFGLSKAFTNLGAGALAQRLGRRRLLIAGWAAALPVPLLIGIAPSWAWVVAANVLLGINQGLAWSMTVSMKIDLVGPRRRGLALGLNEAAGYGGVALAAGLSGLLASQFAARDVLVVAGAVIAATAFVLSILFVRDTAAHVALEQSLHHPGGDEEQPRLRDAFARASFRVPALRACSQAGLVNNLNDGLAWGLVPLFLAAHGASVAQVGLVAAVYPGCLGDRADRDGPLV